MGIDIERTFTYHAPTGNQVERYWRLRAAGRTLAEAIQDTTPQSAERTLAIRAVQQAVMWANAAIAINEHATDPLYGIPAIEPDDAQPVGDAPPYGGISREIPGGAPSSPVSAEADRIAEQEVRAEAVPAPAADPEALCFRPFCKHSRREHNETCTADARVGDPYSVSKRPREGAWCSCMSFVPQPEGGNGV